MTEHDINWGTNLENIKYYLNKHLRVEELKKPDSFNEMLWMLLSGIVCSDGLAFKRAILFLDEGNTIRGKIGIGPLNKEDQIDQDNGWEDKDKQWYFNEIIRSRDEISIKSTKLNSILQQLVCTQKENEALYTLTVERSKGLDIENNNIGSSYIGEEQNQAIIVNINDDWDSQLKSFFTRLGNELNTKLFVMAPLISGGKLSGLLLADDLDTSYDESNVREIQSLYKKKLNEFSYLINQVTIAHEMRTLIMGWKELVDTLTEVHRSISNPQRKTRDLLKKIITEATQLTGATGGILFLRTKSKDPNKYIRAAMTYNLDQFEKMHLKENGGAAGMAAFEKKTKYLSDYPISPYRVQSTGIHPFNGLIEAVVAVPLIVEDKVIGVIDVCSSVQGHKFSTQDIELLEMFAPIAASIIEDNRKNVRFRGIFHALPWPLFFADKTGLIEEFNQEAYELLGIGMKEKLYTKDIYLGGDNEAKKINDLLNDQKEVIKVKTVVLNKKNTKEIPIQLTAVTLVDDLGENFGSLGIMESLASRDEKEKRHLHQQMVIRDLHAFHPDTPINSRSELRVYLKELLRKANLVLHCEWLVCFGSRAEGETVLEPLAWLGLNDDERMPHFNWRKANILDLAINGKKDNQNESKLIAQWAPTIKWREIIDRGLRGENRFILVGFSFGIPVQMAQGLRGVLLLGPPMKSDSNEKIRNLSEMSDFIRSAAGAICAHALSLLQEINLKEQNQSNKQNTRFVIHRAKTSLLPITGAFDAIRRKYNNKERVFEICKIGEESSIKLFEQIENVFKSGISEFNIRDMKFEKSSLATLVLNCISLFEISGANFEREIKADESLENLPIAMIDRIQLSVAIGNILDNAIKYSEKGFYVNVTSDIDLQALKAKIVFHNIGYEMPERARDNLMMPGGRDAKDNEGKSIIPGTGFGLYEASKIIRLHNGTLDFTSTIWQSDKYYHTKVIVTIPIAS